MVVGQVAEGRDLVVVGAGPGGYELALHAAHLGRKVTLVDRDGIAGIGGECLHRGCIPSKGFIEWSVRAGQRGVAATRMDDFLGEKTKTIEQLRSAVERRLSGANVEIVQGIGRFTLADRLVIEQRSGPPTFFDFRTAVVATGSRPISLPSLSTPEVIDAAALLSLEALPASLAVIGGGYIGLELGTAAARCGVAVTIIEMADQLLPGLDRDLAEVASRALQRLGGRVELGCTAVGVEESAVRVQRLADASEFTLPGERVLVAVGRRPNTDDLSLAVAGVKTDAHGLIVTDATCRAIDNVFAIGDVREGPALAHKASAEARMVAEVVSGVRGHSDVGLIPLVVFCEPEVASVGATSADVDVSAGELVAGKVPLAASGRALLLGQTDGFVRVVAERLTGAVRGVQIAAPHAGELIAAATVAIELGAVLDDLASVVFPHPTLGELMPLAARAAMRAGAR